MKVMTNADKIRYMSDAQLAVFIEKILLTGDEMWSVPFSKKFCEKCQPVATKESPVCGTVEFYECDFADGKCPNGGDLEWWLKQPAGGGTV